MNNYTNLYPSHNDNAIQTVKQLMWLKLTTLSNKPLIKEKGLKWNNNL